MSLVILTKSPTTHFFSSETIKRFLRVVTQRKRGPSAVTSSLIRGLDTLSYDYLLNPKINKLQDGDHIWINESLEALKWALAHKQKKNVLVVGPNLVITPLDYNEIICDSKIDIILQPSEWTKDFLSSIKPELQKKIVIWPSGVELPPQSNYKKTIDVLIYSKNLIENNFINILQDFLKREGLVFEIIQYGSFKQKDYFKKVESSKMLIYLSHSESQGLALQEAWARNVPTLVYNRSYFKYKNFSFTNEKISAPYLTAHNGMFFNETNFVDTFHYFWKNLSSFTPRNYVQENLSDTVCAKKFIEILNNTTESVIHTP